MPFGHAGAELREAARVLEEVDDLLQLGGGVVDAGDVVPGDGRLRGGLDLGRLHARHERERLPDQVDDQPQEDQGQPREGDPRKIVDEVREPVHPRLPSAGGGKLKRSLRRARAAGSGGTAADLRRREAVREDDVGGEVVVAADERRADAVGVDRDVLRLELADPVDVEAARDDDLHALEAVLVERVAHLPDEALVDAARVEVAHLVPERAVDERARRVEATPQSRSPKARATSSDVRTESFSKSTRTTTLTSGGATRRTSWPRAPCSRRRRR